MLQDVEDVLLRIADERTEQRRNVSPTNRPDPLVLPVGRHDRRGGPEILTAYDQIPVVEDLCVEVPLVLPILLGRS